MRGHTLTASLPPPAPPPLPPSPLPSHRSDDEVDDPSEPWAREDPADLIATPKHESMHPSLPQHPSQRPSSLTASPANGRADSRLDDQCQPQSDCLPTAFYLWQPGVEASVSVTHPKAGFESYVVMGEAVGKAVAKAANEALLGLRRSRVSGVGVAV